MSAMSDRRQALVVGASRGLGLVLVQELVVRGWRVIATTRQEGGELRALASNGSLEVESLEMTSPEQVAALRERLAGRRLDLLFVNAAIDRGDLPIHEVPTDMFTDVMVTNALSPLRVIEALRGLVVPGGTVDDGMTKLLIDPGHNRTRLGGPGAPLVPEESVPAVVDVLEAQAGAPGLRFLDRHGEIVPW